MSLILICLCLHTLPIFAQKWQFYTEKKVTSQPFLFEGYHLPKEWKEEAVNSFQKKKFSCKKSDQKIILTLSHFKGKTGTTPQNIKRWIQQIYPEFKSKVTTQHIQNFCQPIPHGWFCDIQKVLKSIHPTIDTTPQNIWVASFFYQQTAYFIKMMGPSHELTTQKQIFEDICLQFSAYLSKKEHLPI